MKLSLIFIFTFLAVILTVAGVLVVFKAFGKLVEWLKSKTGRSDTEVAAFVYFVFMALVIAAGLTVAVAVGENSDVFP